MLGLVELYLTLWAVSAVIAGIVSLLPVYPAKIRDTRIWPAIVILICLQLFAFLICNLPGLK